MHVYKTMEHNKVCARVAAVASCGTAQSWPWVSWGQERKGRNFTRFYFRALLVYREKHYKYSFCKCLHLLSGLHWKQSLGNGGEVTSLHWPYMLLVGFTRLFCFIHFSQSHFPKHWYSLPFRVHCYQGKVMVIIVSIFSLASLMHGNLCELLLTGLSG